MQNKKFNSDEKNHSCENCDSGSKGIFCELIDNHSLELDSITRQKVSNVYKKGQVLFNAGNHPMGIYCVKRGTVKLSKMGADGKETIIRIVTVGDIIGHRSLFSEENYQASALAVEECEVCFIDKTFILNLIKNNPSVALNIINKLSRDVGNAEHKMSSFHQKNVRERLAELLLSLKETYGVKEDKRIKITLKLTREEMATMIGTANETLIRTFSEFKDAGIIEQEGKTIYIVNQNELIAWSGLND